MLYLTCFCADCYTAEGWLVCSQKVTSVSTLLKVEHVSIKGTWYSWISSQLNPNLPYHYYFLTHCFSCKTFAGLSPVFAGLDGLLSPLCFQCLKAHRLVTGNGTKCLIYLKTFGCINLLFSFSLSVPPLRFFCCCFCLSTNSSKDFTCAALQSH